MKIRVQLARVAAGIVAFASMAIGCGIAPPPTVNEAPTAVASEPLTASACDPIWLGATDSFDPNGDALSYRWRIVGAPENSLMELDDEESSIATFVADVTGNFTFELTVDDGEFESVDLVTVTVLQPDYTVSFANDIVPLFQHTCTHCHQPNHAAPFLNLTTPTLAWASFVDVPVSFTSPSPEVPADYIVRRCDPTHSALFQRITGIGLAPGEDTMPLGGVLFPEATRVMIRTWIEEGAANN